ncbi:cupin domain-containing protein [Marivita sp.]|uniref:cupin domain-containing protein n=1 Tax=Marivita sp. TaxID=2003365 RepID=UPI00321B652C
MPLIASDFRDGDETGHPILGNEAGPYRFRLLSDPGGLTQFGAFIEELPPGSSSSERHWHETEDEMVYILEGRPTLIEDVETALSPGDAVCWPAGSGIGHKLINRTDGPVRYLVIGTRHEKDVVHYSDHDLITQIDGKDRRYLRRDGTVIPHKVAP